MKIKQKHFPVRHTFTPSRRRRRGRRYRGGRAAPACGRPSCTGTLCIVYSSVYWTWRWMYLLWAFDVCFIYWLTSAETDNTVQCTLQNFDNCVEVNIIVRYYISINLISPLVCGMCIWVYISIIGTPLKFSIHSDYSLPVT